MNETGNLYMDIKTPSERSQNMSRIKARDSKPEIQVRRYLYQKDIRYRCNVKDLPGKPDIAIKKYRTAIIVNGCFWHAHHGCKDFRLPKSNVDFWTDKINGNLDRDKRNEANLHKLNYRTFTIWECEIKSKNYSALDKAIQHINRQKSD